MSNVVALPIVAEPTLPAQISPTSTPVQRTAVWYGVATRMANEGIPIRAIMRTLVLSYDEVREVLIVARERGMIVAMPVDDWPPGSRREDRVPDVAPAGLDDDRTLMLIMRTFNFTPSMSKLFAGLLRRTSMTKKTLHDLTLNDQGHLYPTPGKDPSDVKIIDVFICKMRKKLPAGVVILTLWGTGYTIPPESKEIVFKMLGMKPDTFRVPPTTQ